MSNSNPAALTPTDSDPNQRDFGVKPLPSVSPDVMIKQLQDEIAALRLQVHQSILPSPPDVNVRHQDIRHRLKSLFFSSFRKIASIVFISFP